MALRLAFLIVTILTLGSLIVSADTIEPNVILPGGTYATPGTCVAASCSVDSVINDFVVISSNQVNGNQVEVVTANYQSNIYTNNGGHPGVFVGIVTLPGTLDITYDGRNTSVNPLGTFTTLLTSFDFTGTFNGDTLEVKQNPTLTSGGTTSINQVPGSNPPLFDVSSTIVINGEFSINGGPFTLGPPVTATLVPEPASGSLMLFLAALLPLALGLRWVRAACCTRATSPCR